MEGTAIVTVEDLNKASEAVRAMNELAKELRPVNPFYAMALVSMAGDILPLLEKILAAMKATAALEKAARHD